LARVEDTIFEGLPNDRAKLWPEQFLKAIKIGKDLNKVEASFTILILENSLENFDHNKYPNIKKSIIDIIALFRIGDLSPSAAWSAVSLRLVWPLVCSWVCSWAAAEPAARSAARSAVGLQAESVAWSASRSASSSAAYVKFADKLLELLKNCK